MDFIYKLEDEAGQVTPDSMIEKRGHVIKFSLRELIVNHAALEKLDKELTGQSALQVAKMHKLEELHPFLKDMSEADLFAASTYAQAKAINTQCVEKKKEIEETLTSDRAEIAQIKVQIPALDLPEPVAIQGGNVMEAIEKAQEQNATE